MITFPRKQVLMVVLPIALTLIAITVLLAFGLTALAKGNRKILERDYDRRLVPYILAFVNDMKDRGVTVDLDDLKSAKVVEVIKNDDGQHMASSGICDQDARTITITERESFNWAVIYHELGHCLLHLDHSDRKGSIMYSSAIDPLDRIFDIKFKREDLIDELVWDIKGSKTLYTGLCLEHVFQKVDRIAKRNMDYCTCYGSLLGSQAVDKEMQKNGYTLADFEDMIHKPYASYIEQNICPMWVSNKTENGTYEYWERAFFAVETQEPAVKAQLTSCIEARKNKNP